MKLLATNYTFSPGASGVGNVVLTGLNIQLEQLLLITNTTTNQIIYNFSDSSQGGARSYGSGNTTITLDFNTSGMSSGDRLQIFYDDGSGIQPVSQSGSWSISLPMGAATAANQTTIIGHVDGIEGLLTTIDADTSSLSSTVSGGKIQADVLSVPTVTVQSANLDIRNLSSASDSIASVQSGTWTVTGAGGTFPVTDGGGSLTVDGTVAATQSGAWSARLQDGAGNALTAASRGGERALSVQIVDASGTQVTDFGSNGGGTQYAEDAASTGGESLTLAGAIREDSPSTTVSLDGDYTNLKTDSAGRLWVNASGAAVPVTDNGGSLTVDGTVSANQSGTWTVTGSGGTFPVTDSGGSLTVDNAGTFAVQSSQSGIWTVQPGNTANTTAWLVTGTGGTFPVTDSGGSLTVDNSGTFAVQAAQSGNWSARLQDGSGNAIASSTSTPAGTEQGLIVRPIPSGTQTISGSVSVLSLPAIPTGSNVIGGVTQSGTWTVTGSGGTFPVTDSGGSLTVDNAGTFAVQAAQSGTWNITDISGTVSLPTGAATSAKQPSLGTAGTPSADVITVQGVTSMTPIKVDGSGVTQPVSDGGGSLTVDGTVAATQSGVWTVTGTGGTFPVTDNSGSLTVDAPVGTPVYVRLSDGSSAIANLPINQTQVNGTTVSTNTGNADAGTQRVTLSSDGPVATALGSTSETAPGTDTAASGLNGRLQRIAQRLTSLIGLLPSALTGSGNLKVAIQEATAVPVTDNAGSLTVDNAGTFAVQSAQSGTWTVQPGNTANTTAWLVTGTGGTFPVTDNSGSLTVDAPAGTPLNVQIGDGSNQATIRSLSNSKALNVSVVDSSGNQVTSFSGGGGSSTSTLRQDSFGNLKTALNQNQIDLQFYKDAPAALMTITSSNGGNVTVTNGAAIFSSSNTASGAVRGISFNSIYYKGGSENYMFFTAAFSGGLTSSTVRYGLFSSDFNEGLFIGYEGTSFGVTLRTGGSNSGTLSATQANFNGDTLLGAGGSQFTRAGVVEAIDLAKLNVWCIRYGWVGGAPIKFEVLAPDGNWVTFHTMRVPNLGSSVSVRTGDLFPAIDINKNGGPGTALSITTGCIAAGTTHQLLDRFMDGVAAQTTSGNNICLDVAGTGGLDVSNFKSIALQVNVGSGTVTAGAVTFEASNDNTNWVTTSLYDMAEAAMTPTTSYSVAASTPRHFAGPIFYRFFRARISTGVTGTTTGLQAFLNLQVNSWTPPLSQYAEDVASVGGELMTLAGSVRRDTAASSAGTDGDYATLNTDGTGLLYVNASGAVVPISENILAGTGLTFTLTRPADTTAYAANDAISSSTSTPTNPSISGMSRVNAGRGRITRCRVTTSQITFTGTIAIHVWHTNPTAINDNAVYTTVDSANKAGTIMVGGFRTVGAGGAITEAEVDCNLIFKCASASTTLYFTLEAITAFTPASGQTFKAYFDVVQQ